LKHLNSTKNDQKSHESNANEIKGRSKFNSAIIIVMWWLYNLKSGKFLADLAELTASSVKL
jgi:hypothetical protein